MTTHETDTLAISVEEAGRRIGISRATAYKRAWDGTLPTVRIGNRLLVSWPALLKMFEQAEARGRDA